MNYKAFNLVVGIFLVILLLPNESCAQNLRKILNRDSRTKFDTYDFGTWEIKIDSLRKKELVKRIINFEHKQLVIDNWDFYKNDFHVVDFNLDGLIDLIFYNYIAGSEGEFLFTFLNDGQNFNKILDTYGEILRVSEYDGYTSMSLVMNQYACCAGIINYINSITPVKTNDKFEYLLQPHLAIYVELDNPKTYFKNDIRFVTTENKFEIRTFPESNNDTIIFPDGPIGNVLVQYPKNSIGTAIGETKDKKGKVWWLVVMNENRDIEEIASFIMKHYKILGWVDSSNLKKID